MTAVTADPALARAILAARDKRERRGTGGDGRLVVPDLTAEEALALDGLLFTSRRKPVLPGSTLRVALSEFETALRSSGIDPRAEYERVGGRSLRDLPAERALQQERRSEFLAWLMSHPAVVARPLVAEWFHEAVRQGRVHEAMRPLVEQALRVLATLPNEHAIQRGVLAARILDGDPHALDVGTPLHGLTISVLATAAELGDEASAREVWAAWNVLVDPISSNVAALNLPLIGDGAASMIARAARGTHVVLTYGQLSAAELRWPPGVPCFSCENPSVLIAAEQCLGAASPPLVCTAGRPSDAVRRLLSIVHRAGVRVRHHGDFDEAGVQIFRDLERFYAAVPWRFDMDALGKVLEQPLASSGALEDTVRRLSCPVPEEMVIDDLLPDLRDASR